MPQEPLHEPTNIALPETLKQYVTEQLSERGYGSASEYVGDLIREDRNRREQAKLETLVLDGIESNVGWVEARRPTDRVPNECCHSCVRGSSCLDPPYVTV